jgi:hypothetical protein
VGNLMMARVREELDSITNRKKEDRIIILGMTSNTPAPENLEEKTWLRKLIYKLVELCQVHQKRLFL